MIQAVKSQGDTVSVKSDNDYKNHWKIITYYVNSSIILSAWWVTNVINRPQIN